MNSVLDPGKKTTLCWSACTTGNDEQLRAHCEIWFHVAPPSVDLKRSIPPITIVLLLFGSTAAIKSNHAWSLVKSVELAPWLHHVGRGRSVHVAPKSIDFFIAPMLVPVPSSKA